MNADATTTGAEETRQLRRLTNAEIDDVAGGVTLEEILQIALGALFGKATEKGFEGQLR